MIKIKNISKKFDGIDVINDISFEFDSGMYAIVGKSGCGKSTLLHIIGGLLKPDFGNVYCDDMDITAIKEKELASYRNKKIGFVFQSFFLEDNYSVYENIEIPLLIAKEKNYSLRIKALLRELDLENEKDKKVKDLSGGPKQRVAIARALVNNPSILLCDDPTGNLEYCMKHNFDPNNPQNWKPRTYYTDFWIEIADETKPDGKKRIFIEIKPYD